MSTKVFDNETMFWDAEAAGTFTVATHVSASADLGAADIDEADAGEVIIKWPGLDSAGAATFDLVLADSADDSTFANVLAFPQMDLATAQAELADFRFKLPTKSLRRYVRLSIAVGTAVVSAGVLTAGLVK